MPINEKAAIMAFLTEQNPWGKLEKSVVDHRWKILSLLFISSGL
jgi:hypothetical protein